MPQMAPILWLPLFILVLMSLTLLKSTIYFSFKSASLTDGSTVTKKSTFNWKW